VKRLALLTASACICACQDPPAPAAAAAAASSAPLPAASSAAPSAPTRRPLNVLLLTVDAFRADAAPWLGYSRNTAPNLARLAEQSVVYEQARSVSSYTAQSVVTWLTGRYVSTLYRQGVFFAAYPTCNTFFAEILHGRNVRTMSVQSHLYFGRGKGVDQGFDEWSLVPGITFDAETDNNVTSPKTTELMQATLAKPENTGGRFFAWTHYTDPHDQYVSHPECPAEWGTRRARDRYDCEIFFADLWLGKLLDWARTQAWWKDTAVVVTSDHGEAFGEHGMYKHAFQLWDVLVRVPLLIYLPGGKPRRISEPRSLIDLAPTVFDLLGQPPPPEFVGRSMLPEVLGAAPDSREPLLLELNEDSHNPAVRAVIQGDYKLIVYGSGTGWQHQLYSLRADPGEQQDLARSEPEQLEEMKRVFAKAFAAIPSLAPYGGMKLHGGGTARGPVCPRK
jgi:arylsulfatase A-like enzyme